MSNAIDELTDVAPSDPIRLLWLEGSDGPVGVVAEALERRGRRVAATSVADAEEAGEVVAARAVDCVLLHWERTGADVVRNVRSRDDAIPCVVVADDGDVVERALAAGATDVVLPPLGERRDLVASRVERYVEGYRAERRASELESELRETENLVDQIFEQIPAALYVKDREGRHVRMSNYDVDPQDVIGKTDPEIYGDTEFARETLEDDLHVIETGEPIVNKEEYNPENGEWTITSKVPWYGEGGEIEGLIGVSRLVTEKKEYERELKRTNERLEKFAGIVSHDLRSPLNVATGKLETLRADLDDERLGEIGEALQRIDALIDDLLTLAQQGQTIDDTEPVDLAEAVRRAWCSVVSGDATCDVEADCRIRADETRLRQLLENMLRNAVEHGGEDVDVRVGRVEEGFFVADDGVGVPPEDRPHVFEEGTTTAEDGTGFGLAIVREVASAHGWTVDLVDSQDGGARFEFRGVDLAD